MIMPEQSQTSDILPYRIAVRTATVAAVFSLIVAALMLYDFYHRSMKDPSQTSARDSLKAARKQQPANESIKEELRKLDQQSRDEYFRQQAFAISGAVLLCGGIIVTLAAAKWAATLRRRHPQPEPVATQRDWEANWTPAARWTVGGLFVVLAATAVGLIFPLHTRVEEKPVSQVAAPAKVAAISEEELARAWPCFRGRGGSGISPYTNVPDDWDGPSGKNILWKSPIPLAGHSSPVIVASRIFFTGADEKQRQVYCYNAENGRLLWQHDAPSTPDSRKPLKLNEETGYAASTMATDGRYVVAIFANGDLVAYDLDGELAWSQSLGIPENPYGHAASLSIHKNLLLVPFDQATAKAARSKLRALDIATGHTVWEQTRAVPSSWTTPIVIRVANRDQVVTAASPWIIAYDPAEGKELWRVKGSQGDVAPSPVSTGNFVFSAATDSSPVLAIRADGSGDVTTSHVLWKGEDNTPDICSPLATEEFVFLLNSEGMLTCYDTKKGDKLWEEDLNEFKCKSSPSLVGKQLYVFGESGKCWILAPTRAGVKRVRQTNLGEGCVTCPAFQDGRMVVRGKKNLFCIGQAAKP
ncbi:MAG: PQQ-binding-like beta-propeller repeat protein [Planctomycetota bacterium]